MEKHVSHRFPDTLSRRPHPAAQKCKPRRAGPPRVKPSTARPSRVCAPHSSSSLWHFLSGDSLIENSLFLVPLEIKLANCWELFECPLKRGLFSSKTALCSGPVLRAGRTSWVALFPVESQPFTALLRVPSNPELRWRAADFASLMFQSQWEDMYSNARLLDRFLLFSDLLFSQCNLCSRLLIKGDVSPCFVAKVFLDTLLWWIKFKKGNVSFVCWWFALVFSGTLQLATHCKLKYVQTVFFFSCCSFGCGLWKWHANIPNPCICVIWITN